MTDCPLCDGECWDANLLPLLGDDLAWLWEQVAAIADRRGDPIMLEGTVTVRAPTAPGQRAAALGLVSGRPLIAGQSRRVNLAELSASVRRHGPVLTPGAVAAHAVGRQLAVRARRRDDRHRFEQRLARLGDAWAASSHSPVATAWEAALLALHRAGWVAKLYAADDADRLLEQAFAVLDALPETGSQLDRRVLASNIAHNPHALDDGEPLAALVLALLSAVGITSFGQRSRAAWAAVGVNCDDLTGGLIAVGIYPAGWQLSTGAAVILPPRELASCQWPAAPTTRAWVFVTENPSVASAAADLAATGVPVHLLCTSGTPSAVEVAAIARLVDVGWRVALRADFDAAGIAHVAAMLRAAPSSYLWRMGARDYEESLSCGDGTVPLAQIPDTPWELALGTAMRTRGLATFEEAMLPNLLADLRLGEPPWGRLPK
jgi:uncharacterized protein (TIGR02679 family)